MQLRTFNIGCFGGGTGLPSLLGGLKTNPWLTVNAVVTMFDSGGSSGVLRDQLGVLPPGDVLKCALALARNEREARRVLLSRLPTLEHERLGGHTGGNLLLSMMQQYSGDFLAAVDGLRGLLGCAGRVWPVSVEQASVCAEYGDGTPHARRGGSGRGAQRRATASTRLWLEPEVADPAGGGRGDRAVRGGDHRAGQLLYEPDADLPGEGGAPRRSGGCSGPIVLVTNLLTEGRGMTRLHGRRRPCASARRRRSAVRSTSSSSTPRARRRRRWRATPRSTRRRSRSGDVPPACEVVTRRVLVRRDRAPRSTSAGAGGVGGAGAAVDVSSKGSLGGSRLQAGFR